MGLLTLEVFTSVIESIRLQIEHDKSYASKAAELHAIDDSYFTLYNNSLLIKSLISLLQLHFPKKDNHCDIEHYMFELNFGKCGESTLITIEHLWYQLNKNYEPLVSTHPLIDECGHFQMKK